MELKPLRDNDKDFEVIEQKIRALFKREIYLPLIRELSDHSDVLLNAKSGLLEAIRTGRVQFYRGHFSGRFNATISKEIKALGAQWNRKTGTFIIPQSSLSYEVRNAISASFSQFQKKVNIIDRHLAQIVPEEIADKLKLSDHFDSTLWKVDRDFKSSLDGVTISPSLSKPERKRLADEWQNNMKLHIKDWTQKEIVNLRKGMQASVFAGNRRDVAAKTIQESFEVSQNKAKFLARQETRLLLTKFKQIRYEAAGVNEYKWGCANRAHQAAGAPYVKGQVRHDHARLEGKIFRWDNPPITDAKGSRNNPGQDYNCRCFAIPIVRFKE
jgi:SPP1 gp7 family putative phage head morphogenesis protein